jgi:hypothetical protein
MGGLEGRSPSNQNLPLSFKGEGDTGGEVENKNNLGVIVVGL